MKKIIACILTAAILTMCGCENGETTATTTASQTAATTTTAEETTTTTTEVTTTTTEAVTTTTTEAVTTTAEITTTEAQTSASEEIKPEEELPLGTDLIKNAKTGDGFITYDKSLISEEFAIAGMGEKPLTPEAVMADFELYGNNTKNLYSFAMINTDGVQEYPSNDSTIFMSILSLDGKSYGVTFGTGEKLTLEEVVPYGAPNKYVEYWAFATVNNSQIILIPFIAGSENSGYYLVTPVLEMLGVDVTGMTIPEPVGDDYYMTEPNETDTPESETPAGTAVGQIQLNVTGVENSDVITVVNCKLTNTYDIPICLINEAIYVNGVDCSDKFTAFFSIPAGETIDDSFFLDETQLYAGDSIKVSFSAQNDETYDSLGSLVLEFTLEAQ